MYDQCDVAYHPAQMSSEELREGFSWAWDQLKTNLYIREEEMYQNDRSLRARRRMAGAVTLGVEKVFDRIAGKKEEPVDLEAILGKKKAEVSITTHNVMTHPVPTDHKGKAA